MKKWNWMVIFFLITHNMMSQIVQSVASHPKIVDGIHVDMEGNIYTTPGGLMGGFTIGKAMPNGDYDPSFKDGFNGPIDIDEDSNGVLFITNYDNNTLKSFNPITNEVATIVTNLDGPAGLTLDDEDNIYLTCFGAPPAYNGNQIIKVSPTGNSEVWLESTAFFRPQGITFDDEGNLWVANTPTGEIFRIDTTTKIPEPILSLGSKVGNLVFRKKDQHLYFTSQENHQIYRMDLQGILDTLAGTGIPGSSNGEAMQAQFNKPLGLGFTASEDTLYVAESGKLRRMIELDGPLMNTYEKATKHGIKIFPNPGSGPVTVSIPTDINHRPSKLYVSDVSGQIVFEKDISILEREINIDRLTSGIWYIRLFSKERKMITEEVIVIN